MSGPDVNQGKPGEQKRRYFARYNVEACAWEVFDTVTQTAQESFPCRQDEELRFYAEHRALAHANRLNQQEQESAESGQ